MNTLELQKPSPVPAKEAQGLAFVIPYARKLTFPQKVEAMIELIGFS